jgi:SAM-dependent methyltransferase
LRYEQKNDLAVDITAANPLPLTCNQCPSDCSFIARYLNIETCPDCGLGRTLDDAIAQVQQSYLDESQLDTKHARADHLFQTFLRGVKPAFLLDVGCADGVFISVAAKYGWRTVGIDTHPGGAECVIRADFTDYEFAECFDAITFIHSFEHMDDPRKVLLKTRRLATADGRVLIVVPNFGGAWARTMGSAWQWLNVADHRYHFTEAALSRLLEQTGFRVESISTYSGLAPSLAEMVLSAQGIFDWPLLRWHPLRSLIYRGSRHAGFLSNRLADWLGRGAELQVLARPA